MLILHASALDGRLRLWGETAVSTLPTTSGARHGDDLEARSLGPDASTLRTVFGHLLHGLVGEKTPVDPAVVWLPSTANGSVPSSPLLGELPDPKARLELRPWTVHTLQPPDTLLDLLSLSAERPLLAAGVMAGPTLLYWSLALRFAVYLVAREQFLPGVVRLRGRWHARWESIRLGEDAARFGQLVEAMPDACRAMTREARRPPDVSSEAVLAAVVDTLVDRLVRACGTTTVVTPPIKEGRGRGRRKAAAFESLHDQWLHALRAEDDVLGGSEADLQALADHVRNWRRPIAVTASSPYRLCLRLEEPEGEPPPGQFTLPGNWHVRYLMQPLDDRSLLVPLGEVWDGKNKQQAPWQRPGSDAREYLLAALGQAASLDLAVERSLRSASPEGYDLNLPAAHGFLTQTALLLEQAGFGVLLPAWWTRKGTRDRLAMKATVRAINETTFSGLTLDSLVKFDWQAALGEQGLTFKELEALARLKMPLVKVRGRWVQLSGQEIQAALEFWKKQGDQPRTVRDLVRVALGAEELPLGITLGDIVGEGAVGELLRQLDGQEAFAEMAVPDTFQGTLRPYQVRGFSWLAFLRRFGLGALLADDMGLGKTIQTLALLQRTWKDAPGPTLLICPTSVVGNWQREAARFTPELPVLIYHGAGRKKGEFRKQVEGKALVVSSYALLYRDVERFKEIAWRSVILDEAQNIKNPSTKQAQAARSLQAESRIALTGTPVENHVGDLWSIMEFLNPGFLGSREAFRQSFYLPIQAYRDPEAERRLKRLTGPFVLRRLKTDKSIISDLPDKIETKVFCTLTQEQASLYQAVVKEAEEAVQNAEGIQRRGIILGTLTKLKQVCNHPAHFLGDNSEIGERSGKLTRLTELLEEVLEAGDRALLFTQFTEMGQVLQRYLQEHLAQEALFLHGGQSKKKRQALIDRFQSPDGPALFILSLKAGGTGLNLTAANHVFHIDRWWNPAVENQATDRAFRIGQKLNVQVHKFVCQGTLEEKIDDMIERKREVAGRTVSAGEGWLTELSTDELKELWTLRKSAMGD